MTGSFHPFEILFKRRASQAPSLFLRAT